MKKYIFFTNIPAPYRNSFYNELYKRGVNFEVYFMRATEADRNWKIDKEGMNYPYYIDQAFYMMVGRFHIHINPSLVIKLLKAKGAEIIVGGGWNDLNVLALVILKRLGILKNTLHFWSEANYLTVGAMNDNGFKRIWRKFVYTSSDGAQISPGKMAKITFEKWGIPDKKFIHLPNTIEEEKFTISEKEIALRQQNPTPVFLMPVRLSERIKGIINFFSSIGEDNIRKGLFLIAGAGPDKDMIQAFVHSHGLESNINLLGYCDTEKMAALYRRANVFILPSYSDPSPLSVVEALAMKLPLLVSNRCGNHYEALSIGDNGYLFDPSVLSTVKEAFETLMLRAPDWGGMGEVSGMRYRMKFHKQTVIESFVKSMSEL